MYEGFEEDYGKPIIKKGNIALFKKMNNPPIQWLIEDVLKEKGIGVLYGPSGSMKSYSAVDLACRMVNGMEFNGKPLKQGEVIYIAGEAADETNERIEAWLKYHNKSERPFVQPEAIQIHNGTDMNSLIEIIRSGEAGNVKLVIFDNLADCSVGVSLSDPDDVGEKIKPQLLAFVQQTKAAVLLLHHTGHNESHERGAKVLRDMTDTTIKAKKSTNMFDLTWKLEKVRRRQPSEELRFHIRDVSNVVNIQNMAIMVDGPRDKAAVFVEDDPDDTNPIVDYLTEHGLVEEERNTIAKALDMWRAAKSCVNSTFERYEKEAIESELIEKDGKTLRISPQA